MKNLFLGLLFAALWASASAATKIGILSAEPLVIGNVRFFIAGFLMLAVAYGWQKSPWPTATEWRQLALYGLLNVTLYLGAFVLGVREVSAGIGSLSLCLNPLFISILSAFWLKRPVRWYEWLGLLLGTVGVGVATWPLLQTAQATLLGMGLLVLSMLAYSVGTIYYSSINIHLPLLTINGWQVLFGGLFSVPLTLLFSDFSRNQYDLRFWGSVWWLVLPVSVGAVQLWLYLLKTDAVKASLWLFLCPIFGFVYASVLLHDPISWHTYVGTAFVIMGLALAQKEKFKGVLGK